jgi:alpha-1,3-rhamnosyl/mannosyltransferase
MHYVLDARTATNHFPGIGRYVFNLARAMMPLLQPHETLTLLHNPHDPAPWDLATLTHPQSHLIEVPISPFSLKQQWVIPARLTELKTDLYHSPYYLMPYRLNIPTLLTVYDFIPLRYPQYTSWKARLFFRLAHRWAVQVAHHITTISQATERDLIHFYPFCATKTTTIPLAADTIFQPQPPHEITQLRTKLKLPEQYVLYFGSNKPHKNLIRLVEAWAMIQPQPMPLIIAGAWDSHFPEAKQRVQELGLNQNIQFLGRIPEANLPSLYSGATLFVFPSEYEGFGLPVLEAMACGVPVACAKTSSLVEVAGQAALLFEPTEVTEIATTMKSLITNTALRDRLKAQSLAQAAQFSWLQVATETLKLYRQVTKAS